MIGSVRPIILVTLALVFADLNVIPVTVAEKWITLYWTYRTKETPQSSQEK